MADVGTILIRAGLVVLVVGLVAAVLVPAWWDWRDQRVVHVSLRERLVQYYQEHAAAQQAAADRRSLAAKRGWETRRQKAAKADPQTTEIGARPARHYDEDLS